jgi:hypothetical protein
MQPYLKVRTSGVGGYHLIPSERVVQSLIYLYYYYYYFKAHMTKSKLLTFECLELQGPQLELL